MIGTNSAASNHHHSTPQPKVKFKGSPNRYEMANEMPCQFGVAPHFTSRKKRALPVVAFVTTLL